MVKSQIETLWNEFRDKLDDIFALGYSLPVCLHPSAVDRVGEKLKSWKEQIEEEANTKREKQFRQKSKNASQDLSKTSKSVKRGRGRPRKNFSRKNVVDTENDILNIHQIKKELEPVVTFEKLENDDPEKCEKGEVLCSQENIVCEMENECISDSDDAQKQNENESDKLQTTHDEIRTKEDVLVIEPEEDSCENDLFSDAETDTKPLEFEEHFEEENISAELDLSSQLDSLLSKGKRKRRKLVKKEPKPKVKRPNGRPRKIATDEISAEKTFFCDQCSKGYTTRKSLVGHKKIMHDSGPLTCKICDKTYQSKSGFCTHMRLHSDAFHCPHCDYKTGGKTWMENHIRQVHSKDDPSSRPYLCDLCGDAFAMVNALKRHALGHSRQKTFKCMHCDHVTHSMDLLRTHIKNKHTTTDAYVCNICGDKYKYKGSLVEHQRRHYSDKPYKCQDCDYTCVSNTALTKHRKKHIERTEACDICGKFFSTKDHVRRHRVIHTGEKSFSCTFCNYRCNVQGNLQKHFKNVHNHIPPGTAKKVLKLEGSAFPTELQNTDPEKETVPDNLVNESSIASEIVVQQYVVPQAEQEILVHNHPSEQILMDTVDASLITNEQITILTYPQ